MKTFKQYLSESKLEKHADHFIDYCCDELGIKNKPEIKFVNSKIQAKLNTSFGGYYPGDKKIKVNTAGRHVVDVFRTLAHELVHHKQNEDERLRHDSGKTGSDIENEANSQAGVLLRNYGKAKPELFESMQLDELHTNEITKGAKMGFGVLGDKVSPNATKIGTMDNGHDVYHQGTSNGYVHHYFVVNPKTKKVNVGLSTYQNGKAEEIGSLAANRSSLGAHHLYHHLVTKHNKILTADDQSEGARKVWAKASKMKGIHVHGYDEDDNKAVHHDPKDDEGYVSTKEFHAATSPGYNIQGKDIEKFQADAADVEKQRSRIAVMHKK